VNIGLLLEVLVVAVVLVFLLALFSLHYFALTELLLNEKENVRIMEALAISDRLVSSLLAEERMGVYVNNLVDCGKLPSVCDDLNGIYVSCGPFSCGSPEDKLIVRRIVLYGGNPTVLEVGIP